MQHPVFVQFWLIGICHYIYVLNISHPVVSKQEKKKQTPKLRYFALLH